MKLLNEAPKVRPASVTSPHSMQLINNVSVDNFFDLVLLRDALD